MRSLDLSFASLFLGPTGDFNLGPWSVSSAPAPSPQGFDAAGLPVGLPVDIAQSDNSYLLTAELPGVDPATIEVSVHDGLLRLKGERPTESDRKGSIVNRRERRAGSFERSFTLPKDVSIDGIFVTATNGVVEVTIPKGETEVRRRIDVQGFPPAVVPAAQPPTGRQPLV